MGTSRYRDFIFILSLLCTAFLDTRRVESFAVQLISQPKSAVVKSIFAPRRTTYSSCAGCPTHHLLQQRLSGATVFAKKVSRDDSNQESDQPRGISLLILYMTPWRNPNSLFVYLFLTVYLLGKYSETHSLAN